MTAPETSPASPGPGAESAHTSLIRPFAGILPAPEWAAKVAAPPYDVLSTEEARARAGDNEWNFLHVSRPEIDLPKGSDPYAAEVYAKGGENMARMLAEGVLRRDTSPALYVYRTETNGKAQTGLAFAASIAAYESGRIRRHELTRPPKVRDRARQIATIDAQTGPVMVVHRADAAVHGMLDAAASGPPEFSVTADDGVRHTLWAIRDADKISRLTDAFEAMDRLYIADGHHRSEAAAQVAAERRAANPRHRGDEPYNFFLAVSFPDDEVSILDYNRAVRDLAGRSADDFLAEAGKRFSVRSSDDAVRPDAPRRFGMYLDGRWYGLTLKSLPDSGGDPASGLDVSLLASELLGPVLGIGDPRTDPRIDFIGGGRGLDELERRVDSGKMAVAFALFPTSIGDLITVADAGGEMPPKSTWFEPKLADGLISLPI